MTASTTEQKRRSLLMIVIFTLLSAAAQVLLKFGSIQLKLDPSVAGLATNVPCWAAWRSMESAPQSW